MGSFATSLSCMDGRVQGPLQEWIRSRYGVEYVDTVTLPGMDGAVGGGGDVDSVRGMAALSVEAHGSRALVVSGHHDCAGNPVSREEHIAHIRRGVDAVRSWGLNASVVGVWVNDKWRVEPV